MSENTDKNKKPAIRFKGFQDTWEQRKLGDIFKYEQPQAYIVESTEYDDKNDIPVLTAGQSFILGYTDERFGIKEANEDNPVIIFDDFTTSSHYVDFPFKIKSSAMKLLTLNNPNDDTHCTFNVLQNIGYVPVSHERHWISTFAKFNVLLPKSSSEQKQIGAYFRNLDNLIALHQRKLEKLKNVKKSMLEKMFPQNGSNVPQIRFAGFTAPWEQRKLSEFGKATGGTSIESEFVDGGKYKVISIGSYSETSKYTDQGIRANKTRKTENRILNKNDLTMILNDKTASGNIIGRVLLINADDSYVFNQRTERIEVYKNDFEPEFLYQLLNADHIRSKIIQASQGNTQIYVNWSVISELVYQIPSSKDEQEKIARYFRNFDNLITLHQHKLEKLQNIKKSLLEKMFV